MMDLETKYSIQATLIVAALVVFMPRHVIYYFLTAQDGYPVVNAMFALVFAWCGVYQLLIWRFPEGVNRVLSILVRFLTFLLSLVVIPLRRLRR